MPHTYTNTAPQTVKQLDPDLPLIRMDASQPFAARMPDGKLHGGRIHPQRLNKDTATSHPSLFYVEFPAASANYYEVSIPKLTRILGEGSGESFTLTQAARILSSIPRRHHFLNLITIARP
jgi:hypothetical protein